MFSMQHPIDLHLTMMPNPFDALVVPGCRVSEDPDGQAYMLFLEAPGVKAQDLTIDADTRGNGRLAVRGETSIGTQTHSVNHTVTLPSDADANAATAESVDGIIQITIPKKAPAEPMRVDVSTNHEGAADESLEEAYQVTVVAAGVAASDLDVRVDDRMLTVRGESEKTGARVARRYVLPRDADAPATTAVHIDGVLTLTVPKKAAAEPKRVLVAGVHA